MFKADWHWIYIHKESSQKEYDWFEIYLCGAESRIREKR